MGVSTDCLVSRLRCQSRTQSRMCAVYVAVFRAGLPCTCKKSSYMKVSLLETNPSLRVKIARHADSVGGEETNKVSVDVMVLK